MTLPEIKAKYPDMHIEVDPQRGDLLVNGTYRWKPHGDDLGRVFCGFLDEIRRMETKLYETCPMCGR